MSDSEEKLAGADQALAELGKSDGEISEVRQRVANAEPADLQAVDAELSSLADAVSLGGASASVHTAQTRVPEAAASPWDDEHTEVEMIDESDFVLLVDEDDLEELEKVGEEDARMTSPPALPQGVEADVDADVESDEEDEGFFKKLFGTRRSSNSP